MKKQFTLNALLLVAFLFFGSSLLASFPVHKTANKTISSKALITKSQLEQMAKAELQQGTKTNAQKANASGGGDVVKFIITILLWFFLGGFAAHRWFAGKPIGWNILFILTLGGLGIWWLIDGVMILTGAF